MSTREVLQLLDEKKLLTLKVRFTEMQPADIAALFSDIIDNNLAPHNSLIILYRILPKETAAESFTYMDSEIQEVLINAFTDKELQDVLDELYIDDTVDMIEEMPANVVSKILSHVDRSTRSQINDLLQYPKDSAGSIMTTEFVYFKVGSEVRECFERIRSVGIMKETVYTCYVTDCRRLVGVVTVLELLMADPETLVEDIADTNFISVNTSDDKESVAKTLSKYDLHAIPVCDNEKRIVGIVTFDDALDVLEEENTEDFAKMAAISPIEDSYFKTSVWRHAASRLPWLLFLMLSATLTGFVTNKFEVLTASVPVLISLMPMIMGTAGNSGSQSSTLIIRGMAVDEIHLKDFLKVLWKEIRVAVLCSVCLAVVNGLRIYFFEKDGLLITLAVSFSIIGVVILAKVVGSMLPMLAKRIKLDPAIMATPMISTILDTCSLLIYFTVATIILNNYL
ncbi:MAG: magnesium transporter [Ruminococcus sp.]|jgi:magnesium transporter|nr:magnesium transporter [Ruminococcus sp.]